MDSQGCEALRKGGMKNQKKECALKGSERNTGDNGKVTQRGDPV